MQHNSMRRHSKFMRIAVLLALVVAVLAASGCRWFRKGSPYAQSAETRPLEVPPDLDRPNTAAALGAPTSVSRSTMSSTPMQAGQVAAAGQAAPAGASGFTVPGERDEVFAKVGEALAGVQGLTVASKAQLLGTYDVNYEGANFLVRVTKVESGVYVSAVDPRGVAAAGDAPGKLIAALKTALGG